MDRLPVFYFISYGARINQKFDLVELQRLHRKIHWSRKVQIHYFLVATLITRSAPRSWLIFSGVKKTEKNNANKLSQLHALEPARCAVITPANTYYGFVVSSHICLPAHSDVAGSIFSNSFFSSFVFVQKIEPARCHRARPMCLS